MPFGLALRAIKSRHRRDRRKPGQKVIISIYACHASLAWLILSNAGFARNPDKKRVLAHRSHRLTQIKEIEEACFFLAGIRPQLNPFRATVAAFNHATGVTGPARKRYQPFGRGKITPRYLPRMRWRPCAYQVLHSWYAHKKTSFICVHLCDLWAVVFFLKK